jgi:hypothetical protein
MFGTESKWLPGLVPAFLKRIKPDVPKQNNNWWLSSFSYWSSSESGATKAWFQNFTNGLQIRQVKTAAYALRPVRRF